MIPFVESDEFAAMNVGVELDESAASPLDNTQAFFYQDKSIWHIEVICKGDAVHSSTFPASEATAVGKCRKVINFFMDYRDEQRKVALANGSPIFNAGPFTAVSLNRIHAGTANNIVPSQVSLVFDIRLATGENTTALEEKINNWIKQAGDNVSVTFLLKDKQSARVVTSPENPYYAAMVEAAKQLGVKLNPLVSAGATDARYLRLKNIPAFGYTPMGDTQILLHTDNERVNATTEGYQMLRDHNTSSGQHS